MNKNYKMLFWIFPLIILLNILGYMIYQITGVSWDLVAAIVTIYIGGPLWVIFLVFSIVLVMKKKADSSDKKLFVAFIILSLGVSGFYLYSLFLLNLPSTTPSLVEQNPELKDWINSQKKQ